MFKDTSQSKSDNYEIIDTENFTPEKEQQFSHQQLVMKVMNKCLDAGCKEMRAGYYNNKQDKNGNMIITYVEDTRKTFIGSVETTEMVMVCDLDKEAHDKIEELKVNLDKTFNKLIDQELDDWKNSSVNIRKSRWVGGIFFRAGNLNIKLPYYQDYMEERVKTFRLIFKELTKLTNRLGFYEEEYLEV